MIEKESNNIFNFEYKIMPDQYGGQGLFAKNKITAKSIIYRESDLTQKEIHMDDALDYFYSYCLKERKKIIHHCWAEGNYLYHCISDVKWKNHSDTPNTCPILEKNKGINKETVWVAMKDIYPNEEMTFDYRLFSLHAPEPKWFKKIFKKVTGTDIFMPKGKVPNKNIIIK